MKLDIPTAIITAVIVAVVTFALTFALTGGGEAVETEKIVTVERKLTADEQRAMECYRLFNVWWVMPEGAAGEDRALDAVVAECVP